VPFAQVLESLNAALRELNLLSKGLAEFPHEDLLLNLQLQQISIREGQPLDVAKKVNCLRHLEEHESIGRHQEVRESCEVLSQCRQPCPGPFGAHRSQARTNCLLEREDSCATGGLYRQLVHQPAKYEDDPDQPSKKKEVVPEQWHCLSHPNVNQPCPRGPFHSNLRCSHPMLPSFPF
jgi:hypothetical protein